MRDRIAYLALAVKASIGPSKRQSLQPLGPEDLDEKKAPGFPGAGIALSTEIQVLLRDIAGHVVTVTVPLRTSCRIEGVKRTLELSGLEAEE